VRAYVAALGGSIDVVARLGDRSWKVTISCLDSEAAAGADPADAESLADLRDVIFCATNCRQERSPTSTLPDPARLSDRAPPA
jgi:hypothetical protein